MTIAYKEMHFEITLKYSQFMKSGKKYNFETTKTKYFNALML